VAAEFLLARLGLAVASTLYQSKSNNPSLCCHRSAYMHNIIVFVTTCLLIAGMATLL